MVAERIHRRRRNRIHRVAAYEFLDIQHVAIRLVLHARAGPEQALRVCADGRELLPPVSGHHVRIQHVGHLCVRDGHLAAQFLQRVGILVAGRHPLVDLLVDLRVDTADEEACHAGDAADVLALRVSVL